MRSIKILFAFAILPFCTIAQNITGDWYGTLKAGSQKIPLVFHITKTASGYLSTMDSPNQGALGIPVASTLFTNSTLKLEVPGLKIEYSGELKDTIISGFFTQGGIAIPLNLSRNKFAKEDESSALKRSQDPVMPYPYYSEDVTFKNEKDNITLAGTLTLPKKEGIYPAVVLITGSGPQDRNEEMLGHKPFLVISDYLTRNGIAVLRYDDRGVGKSGGKYATATTADFANDAESAFSYLQSRKEINAKKIGLVGHSEGGTIAPMVAARNKQVDFIVMLAGPGLQGNQILLLQKEKIEKISGIPDSVIAKDKKMLAGAYKIVISTPATDTTLGSKIQNYLETLYGNEVGEAEINTIRNQITYPWMRYFIQLNPIPFLEKVKCPVLALNGGNDLQVLPKENLSKIAAALKKGGNNNVTTKEFPGLNHLFQESKTGLPSEYAKIDQTFSPDVMKYMTEWIKKQVK